MSEATNIAVLPTAEHRPALTAGARPMAIVPTDMDSAYRLAKAVCMAGMAPKGLDTPEKAMVAILHGLELGLTPMAALQRIAVVNGRPVIWGDGAMSLVRGSGACEYVSERLEGEGENMRAICEAKRKGEREPIVRTFSVADAKRAGLWGKSGPWQQFPTRMLAMRARAFCLRDGFADVLGGLYLKEELEDTVQHAPPPPPPEVSAPPAPLAIERQAPRASAPPPPPPPPPPAEPARQSVNPEKVRAAFEKAAKAAPTIDALNDAWNRIVAPVENDLFPPDQEDCVGIFRRRERELED